MLSYHLTKEIVALLVDSVVQEVQIEWRGSLSRGAISSEINHTVRFFAQGPHYTVRITATSISRVYNLFYMVTSNSLSTHFTETGSHN